MSESHRPYHMEEEFISAAELGDVAASLLDEETCESCGSHFIFMDGRRTGKYTWWIYVRCPNCDGPDDDLRAFRIKRSNQPKKKLE